MTASNDNLSANIFLTSLLYIGHPLTPDCGWGVALSGRRGGDGAGKRGTVTEIFRALRQLRVLRVFPVAPKEPRPNNRIPSVIAVSLEEILKISRTGSEWLAS